MLIAFSGETNGRSLPERALADWQPTIMLTYYCLRKLGGTVGSNQPARFKRHVKRRKYDRDRKKGRTLDATKLGKRRAAKQRNNRAE